MVAVNRRFRVEWDARYVEPVGGEAPAFAAKQRDLVDYIVQGCLWGAGNNFGAAARYNNRAILYCYQQMVYRE